MNQNDIIFDSFVCKMAAILSSLQCVEFTTLAYWHRDKIAAISQTTFPNAFARMWMHECCLIFHWSLPLLFGLTLFQHWFRQWTIVDQATSRYMNQWWVVYWRIYVSPGLNELNERMYDTLTENVTHPHLLSIIDLLFCCNKCGRQSH